MALGKRSLRPLLFGALIALGGVAAVSGQAGQPPAAQRTQMDELLTEVRAIRADLDRAAAASLRGQLLGMRLQLQEQRIAALGRQLADVQQRLRDNAQARTSMLGSLKMFAAMKGEPGATAPDKDDKDGAAMLAMMLGPLKQQIAALDKAAADLQAEETTLLNQMNDEQSRWSAFNAQVEEMERASSKRAIR